MNCIRQAYSHEDNGCTHQNCYDLDLAMSQQAICTLVIKSNHLTYLTILVTPRYSFILFIFFILISP